MKCLKQVLRWASSLRLTIFWKWEWYIWAYTLKRRLNIVLTTSWKLGGKGAPAKVDFGESNKIIFSYSHSLNAARPFHFIIPSFWGNIDSSSSWASIQSIKYSTYFGAETSIGFLICTPSAHLYSYLWNLMCKHKWSKE